jgi:hypothetical protein
MTKMRTSIAIAFALATLISTPIRAGGWYDGYGGAWHSDSTGYGDDGMLHYGGERPYGSERSGHLNGHRHRHCWITYDEGYQIRICR